MTTVMYQGIQSCFESQLVESRLLKLKLASPKPSFSQPIELAFKPSSSLLFDSSCSKEMKDECHSDKTTVIPNSFAHPKTSGWSFIQSLSSVTYNPKPNVENENTYVHPLVKNSSKSPLRDISLELCTESLGSESGTDIIDSSIFSFLSTEDENVKPLPRTREVSPSKKMTIRSFPPALTTMRGSESLQYKPHREDGRLVIKAVKAPSHTTLFQVERSDGRLRLSFLNHDSDSKVHGDQENEGKCENELSYEDEEEEENEEESDVLLSKDTDVVKDDNTASWHKVDVKAPIRLGYQAKFLSALVLVGRAKEPRATNQPFEKLSVA